MNNKVLVIISSSDKEKALTGMMYATNAHRNLWFEDVKLIFFGPAQKVVLSDKNVQKYLAEYIELDGEPVTCRFIAERDKITDKSKKLGIKVDYVGENISNLIKSGYTPMIW